MFNIIMVLGFVTGKNLMLVAIRLIWMAQVKNKREKWNGMQLYLYKYEF